jgi:hypothetical protein
VTRHRDAWHDLTPQERIGLCRAKAKEAQAQAYASTPSHMIAYQVLAAQWLDLAAEIEQWRATN